MVVREKFRDIDGVASAGVSLGAACRAATGINDVERMESALTALLRKAAPNIIEVIVMWGKEMRKEIKESTERECRYPARVS